LDPAFTDVSLKTEDMLRAESFLKANCSNDNWLQIRREFHEFRQKEGPLFGPGPGAEVYDIRRSAKETWQRLGSLGSQLAPLARRIFTSPANSVPSERSFSSINYLHNKARNRLTPANTDMLAFIYMNSRVLRRLDPTEGSGFTEREQGDRWETVKEAVLLEMEDEFQSLYNGTENDLEDNFNAFGLGEE
jgi:hypothetical protein